MGPLRQLSCPASEPNADDRAVQVSKSYLIAQITTGEYYYPRGELGLEGERSELPRPLKDGEDMEWILLNGTPGESKYT